jgi:hypothetical protein
MSRKWFLICTAAVALALWALLATSPALALDPTPGSDANCVSCHENQYYLYDAGKYYCLCEAPMHCVYCHGGRTDSYDKEIAHEGLNFYPTADQAARCRTCHEEDYMARLVKFDAAAGVGPAPLPMATATPGVAAVLPQPPSGAAFSRLGRLDPWIQVALGLTAFAMVGVLILGYRCWRLDCLPKPRS